MKLKKPKFWDYKEPNLISNILFPISKIVEFLSKIKISKKQDFKQIKSICVGNIYLGGTGKTSLAVEIKKILNKSNFKSCFIKKDYSDQIDEQELLKNYGKTFVDKSRIKALKKAISENYQVAIFDDGLQDKSISYDLSFICFNQKNLIGNGRLIPAGPLRESLDNLENSNIFLIGNNDNNIFFKNFLLEKFSNLDFFDCIYEPLNFEDIKLENSFIVFSGIGNHQTFIDMLKKKNFKIIKDLEYPDHYNYSKNDMDMIYKMAEKYNAKILTTKKDYLRLNKNYKKEIQFINVSLKIKQLDLLQKKLNFK